LNAGARRHPRRPRRRSSRAAGNGGRPAQSTDSAGAACEAFGGRLRGDLHRGRGRRARTIPRLAQAALPRLLSPSSPAASKHTSDASDCMKSHRVA